jgi:hypothetical protein
MDGIKLKGTVLNKKRLKSGVEMAFITKILQLRTMYTSLIRRASQENAQHIYTKTTTKILS